MTLRPCPNDRDADRRRRPTRRPAPAAPVRREIPVPAAAIDEAPDEDAGPAEAAPERVARWLAEQAMAADVRAALVAMDPNRREAWCGWREHRTRTAELSVTVSWAERFAAGDDGRFVVPHLAGVLEALLVGAAAGQDELSVADECDLYRDVVGELARRIDAIESCYA